MDLSITILGYSALVIWLGSKLPQIKQMYDTKEVEDVNFFFLFLDFLGNVLYTIYSSFTGDTVIILSSAMPIFFNTILLWLWCKYKKNITVDISNNQLQNDILI